MTKLKLDLHEIYNRGDKIETELNRIIQEAVDNRIKKYIAAYAAAMGGVDAIIFTGGIGQKSPEVREAAVDGLGFMGVELHREHNAAVTGDEADVATEGSRVRVLVIPTNEEKTIARDVVRVLNGIMPVFSPPETIT